MKTIVYNGLGGIQNDLKRFAYRLTQDDERAKDLLDEKYRKPLEMYISGFKYKEISEKENIPIGTIKSRLAYGRNLIKNYLKL